MSTILDQYVRTPPDIQNALDIFVSEWSSRLPVPFAHYRAGTIPLFEDPRVEWGVKSIGGLAGKSVLELGPLEAGHTYMIERFGAASVCAIEANTRSFLKCLIVKEVLDLKRTRFLCGDFVEYLKHEPVHFDVAFASGVLYHMQNPAELVALLSKTADHLFMWSHYYDGEIFGEHPVTALICSRQASKPTIMVLSIRFIADSTRNKLSSGAATAAGMTRTAIG